MQREPEGFTLLELIVISVVVGILAALAAPSFFGYLNRQRMNAAQDEILSEMRRAQSEARRRQEQYQFTIETAADGAILTAVHPIGMDSGTNCRPANVPFMEIVSAEDDIQVDNVSSTLIGGADCNTTTRRLMFGSDGTVVVGVGELIVLQLGTAEEIRRCVGAQTILGSIVSGNNEDCI